MMAAVMLRFAVLTVLALSGVNAEDISLARPSAIVVSRDDHSTAFVANQSTGTIARVDLTSGKVVQEFQVGEGLSDLVDWPGQPFLLAVDSEAHRLYVLRITNNSLLIARTVNLPSSPSRIAVSDDGKLACVTFQWSKFIHVVDLRLTENAGPDPKLSAPIDVGFFQQQVVALSEHRFLVADRFRGGLALVDSQTRKVLHQAELQGHNIRGIAVESDGESVLVAHQILSRVAHTTLEDIHWGMVMQNVIRRVPLATYRQKDRIITSEGRLYRPGDTGDGFGDPSGTSIVDDGILVLSAGTNQAMLMSTAGRVVSKASTGVRPVRMASINATAFAVVNSLSNSISVIEIGENGQLKNRFQPHAVVDEAATGEAAFFDAKLSHDGWMSCHSCHSDGHSSDFLADTLGDGSYGNPKRIPSLMGVSDSGPWGWNGGKEALRSQLEQTFTSTMHNKDVSEGTIDSLVDYLATLNVPEQTNPVDGDLSKGEKLFASLDCVRCHNPQGHYTSNETFDVGLKDESGVSRFNPPSLRGVGLRSRYFHDARANSLESVFKIHKHMLKKELDANDRTELIRFLKTL